MEIEAGEYVRTNGIFGKAEQIGNSLFWLEDGSSYSLSDKEIKHSKNIIDLIEVGDYVNGQLVRATYLEGVTKYIKLNNSRGVRTYNDNIKTILTHEQYIQNCYTVERKEYEN